VDIPVVFAFQMLLLFVSAGVSWACFPHGSGASAFTENPTRNRALELSHLNSHAATHKMHDQAHQEKCQEEKEQNLGNSGRRESYAAKSQDSCDYRNQQEH